MFHVLFFFRLPVLPRWAFRAFRTFRVIRFIWFFRFIRTMLRAAIWHEKRG